MYPDFMYGLTPCDLRYDIETYPNVITFSSLHPITRQRFKFEISDRINQIHELCGFLETCGRLGVRGVGFNNEGFDYPVLHWIYQNRNGFINCVDIYNHAMKIIAAQGPAKYNLMVWESDRIFEQIDLFAMNNAGGFTSLKVLEFNMRMDDVSDLPFELGSNLDDDQKDQLWIYNDHDVDATDQFANENVHAIAMREELSAEFNINMINLSEVKIGEKILIHTMEQAGIEFYEYVGKKKTKRQTIHKSINLKDVIFNYVNLEHPEFQRVQRVLESKLITETKGVFTDLIAHVDGLEYKIGTGGLHASVESQTVRTTDTHTLIDVDVASFYPNLGIKNKLYPAHLGPSFCDAMEGMFITRGKYPKSDPRNGAYKLGMNAAYGNSNNKYSVFYDMFYTMSITINGQLSLLMLCDQLLKVPGLRMIQGNTDGITYLCPNEYIEHTRTVCKWWEDVTKLELEEVIYDYMCILNVNNYLAVKSGGDVKRIGAYAHVTATNDPSTRELVHKKDWSARVVAIAAEQALVYGADIREFIMNHDDVYDFLLRTKVPRSNRLEWGGEVVPNIIRYYISTNGDMLEKVAPARGPEGSPKRASKLTDEYYNNVLADLGVSVVDDYTFSHIMDDDARREAAAAYAKSIPHDDRIHTKNKSTYDTVYTGIHAGSTVVICNNLQGFTFSDIDYEWYIKEVEKLVLPLRDN